GNDLVERFDIIEVAKSANQYQGACLRLPQKILDLAGAEIGIHGYEHRPDLGQGKLKDDPLRDVRSPQSDSVVSGDTQTEQSFRNLPSQPFEFGEIVAQ